MSDPFNGKIAESIASLPLFEGNPPEILKLVSSIAEARHLRKGELVFSEGDPGKGFFVITSGQVKIFKVSPDGKEQILHVFGRGEPFAEVALFEGMPYPAFAEAMEESEIIFFARDRFLRLIRDCPDIALKMLAVLSMRLKKFTVMIEHLSLRDVPARLASYLLLLRERRGGTDTFDLDLPKGHLASLLGTIPETLSRIFARLSSQSFIHMTGSRVQILDLAGLKALAEGISRLA